MRSGFVALMCSMLVVMVMSCAKKMLPPSPDRFPPSLQEVDVRTRSQVALVFDEPISGAGLSPDSFVFIGSAGETLALHGVSLGRKNDEVQLWTPTQQAMIYQLQGVVRDVAGNADRFRARFMGSTKRDTIPPRVIRVEPGPGATRQKHAITVRVTFSEAIDTASLGMAGPAPESTAKAGETSGMSKTTGAAAETVMVRGPSPYMFVPAAYDTQFKRSWASDWQSLGFERRESVPAGTIIYFLLQPKVTDLEGNRIKGSAFTYFTGDTALDVVPVKGKAILPDSLKGSGVVFFTESAAVHTFTDSLNVTHTETLPTRTTALAPLLTDGSFSTKVRKGEYEVEAVVDTNADGLADFVSQVVEFNTDAESLSLTLQPESLSKPLNAYRR